MKPSDRENKRYLEGVENKVEREEEVMFKLLPRKKGKLLDVGCGTGEITLQVENMGFDVSGIDFSEVAVDIAKSKGIDALVHDIDTGLPYADKSFDVIWCGDIIEHVFDPIFVLKEINRILKDDGVVLISIPNDLNIFSRIRVLFGKSPQSSIYERFSQAKHHTIVSLELLKYFVDISGFTIDKFKGKIEIPKIYFEFICSNKSISSLFATVFILKLRKRLIVT